MIKCIYVSSHYFSLPSKEKPATSVVGQDRKKKGR